MRGFLPVFLLAAAGAVASGSPWDALHERSVSRSHQFVVYAADPNARAAVAMDAEDVKDRFLALLDATDLWKDPIIIQVSPENAADPNQPPSRVTVVNTEDGVKIDLNVVLDSDPRDARFPEQLVRALLLEFAYRDQPALVAPGREVSQPPDWLVEGIASLTAAQPDTDTDAGVNAGLFRSLILSGKTPTLAMFLSENPATLDGPSMRLYAACSMSLVRLLAQLPNGRVLLQKLIHHWPGPNADPEAELLKAFPALDSGGESLEKWWALGLASLSASDRYQGLSLEETCRQLDELLRFDVVVDKTGKTHSYTLDQYADFKKAPGAVAALNNLAVRLIGLEAQASPLMRDVVGAYEAITVQLAHRQSHHLRGNLEALGEYRSKLTEHMDQIADYLNWYEATQRTQASGSFDEYIRTANEAEKQAETPRSDPISKYMDSVEQELAQ
jgi:hypothetical protein